MRERERERERKKERERDRERERGPTESLRRNWLIYSRGLYFLLNFETDVP